MIINPDMDQDSVFSAEQVLENRGRIAIFIDGSNLFMPLCSWALRLTTPNCYAV